MEMSINTITCFYGIIKAERKKTELLPSFCLLSKTVLKYVQYNSTDTPSEDDNEVSE